MRRPLALWGFALFGCCLCHMAFGKVAVYGLSAVALTGLLLCMAFYKKIRPHPLGRAISHLCLIAGISVILTTCFGAMHSSSWLSDEAVEQPLVMTVIEERGHYDRSGSYTVTTQSLGEKEVRLRLQAQGETRYRVGDVIQGTVTITAPSSSQADRLKSEQIVGIAKTVSEQPPAVIGQETNVYFYADQVRKALLQTIRQVLPEPKAAMVSGICLGDTSFLPDTVVAQFRQCGMSHMTAVSGLHTTTLVGFLVALFLLIRWRRRWANLLGVVCVWSFIFVVGMPVSSIRAGIMFTLLAVVSFFRYRSDTLNNLGGAALVILLINPYAVADVGFVASFSTCLGIVLLAAPCGKLLRSHLPCRMRRWRWVVGVTDSLGVTIGAFLAGLPCALLCFYQVSWIAPVANLVGVPLAGGVLVCSLLGGLLSFVPGLSFCGGLLLVAGGLLAELLMAVARVGAGVPYAARPFASGWCVVATLLVLVVGLWTYQYRDRLSKGKLRGVAWGLTAVLMASSFLPVYGNHTYEVFVVGNEYDTTVAVVGQNQCVVIGCSSLYSVQKVLASRQVERVDRLVVPYKKTYGESLREFYQTIPVEQMHLSEQSQEERLASFAPSSQCVTHRQIQVADIGVTANEDFTVFTIHVGGKVITYNTQPHSPHATRLTIEHPNVAGVTAVTVEQQRYRVDDWFVLRVQGEKINGYRPRYLYS